MRIPRIYLPQPLSSGSEVKLDSNAMRHVVQVLRLKPGHSLILFNGEGGEYTAVLSGIEKRHATVQLGEFRATNRESKLFTHIGLGICKGERMDFALQKAVELGVSDITPLITEHCVVRIDDKRAAKKQDHWQSIINSACEQSGRNTLPNLNTFQYILDWLGGPHNMTKLIFEPTANKTLSAIETNSAGVVMAIGPEGGFSPKELEQSSACGFTGISLGPRILRTESAVIAGLAAIQTLWGDFG